MTSMSVDVRFMQCLRHGACNLQRAAIPSTGLMRQRLKSLSSRFAADASSPLSQSTTSPLELQGPKLLLRPFTKSVAHQPFSPLLVVPVTVNRNSGSSKVFLRYWADHTLNSWGQRRKVRTVLRGAMQIIEDVKLPTDEVRKEFCDSHHARCCLNCAWESQFDPRNPNDIGRPLLMFLIHPCADIDHRDR